jgi:hypothetical protein
MSFDASHTVEWESVYNPRNQQNKSHQYTKACCQWFSLSLQQYLVKQDRNITGNVAMDNLEATACQFASHTGALYLATHS